MFGQNRSNKKTENEMGKTFVEVIFKPLWKWLISMPLEIIGLLTFINPNWGNVINYPSLSRDIPWYLFVIIGLIIWGIGTAWEAAKRIQEKDTQTPLQNINNVGESGLFVRDNYGSITQTLSKDTKRIQRNKDKSTDQEPFMITAREPVDDDRPRTTPRSASLNIGNTSPYTIKKCFVKMDHIYDKDRKEMLYSRERRLSWSSGQPQNKNSHDRLDKEIEIVIKEPAVVDVAETSDNVFIPTVWFGKGASPLPIGSYEIHITAHGKWRGKDIFKEEIFILEYNGMNDIPIRKKSEIST